MWWLLLIGLIAGVASFLLVVPPSREIIIKSSTLVDVAREEDPELFRTHLEAHNPIAGQRFLHARLKGLLRADLSDFSAIPRRLQRELRALDRKAHVGLWPLAAYAVCVALWLSL